MSTCTIHIHCLALQVNFAINILLTSSVGTRGECRLRECTGRGVGGALQHGQKELGTIGRRTIGSTRCDTSRHRMKHPRSRGRLPASASPTKGPRASTETVTVSDSLPVQRRNGSTSSVASARLTASSPSPLPTRAPAGSIPLAGCVPRSRPRSTALVEAADAAGPGVGRCSRTTPHTAITRRWR